MDGLHLGFDRPFERLSDRLGGALEGELRLVSAAVTTITLPANGSESTATPIPMPGNIEENDLVIVAMVGRSVDGRPYFVNDTGDLSAYRSTSSSAYYINSHFAWFTYRADLPPLAYQNHTSARAYDFYVIVLRDGVVANGGTDTLRGNAGTFLSTAPWIAARASGLRSLGLILCVYNTTDVQVLSDLPPGYTSLVSLSGETTSFTAHVCPGRPANPVQASGVMTLNKTKGASASLGLGVYGS